MDYEALRLEVDDGVATVTLNRPDHLNAYTARMGVELADAMAGCDEDDVVRAVVVTGAGRAFCAGADLSGGGFGGRREEDGSRPERKGLLPWQVRKPVIAAINGHAIGVGLTYPMTCDVRYVAEDAKLSFAFVRRGVIPELASHAIVARVAGLSNAAELLLSGRTISGREAVERGLATRALPVDEVLPAARELATDIAVNVAPVSAAISKRLLWGSLNEPLLDVQRREGELFVWCAQQPDAKEGVAAFLERRAPSWTLRASRDLPTV